MAESTQAGQAPVQVQIVEEKKPSLEDRFFSHVERAGTAPTMHPGDTQQRQLRPDAPRTEEAAADTAATESTAAEAAPVDEEYEFEWRDARYRVPKELKELHDGYLRQEDYTTKQQEVAEIRRSAEAALQQSRAQQELQSALAPQVSRLNEINAQLDQYNKVDWNVLFRQDSTLAQQHSVQFSVLTNQKQLLERQVQTTAQEHMRKITDAQNQMLSAADKAMALKVKGWTRDSGKSLNEFARKAYGFTEQEVNTTLDPRALEMMHDAKQWRELQSSKAQKVVIPQKTIKPDATAAVNSAQAKAVEARRGIRAARTDSSKAKAIADHPMWDRMARSR